MGSQGKDIQRAKKLRKVCRSLVTISIPMHRKACRCIRRPTRLSRKLMKQLQWKRGQSSNGGVKGMLKANKRSLYHYISSKRLKKKNVVLISG